MKKLSYLLMFAFLLTCMSCAKDGDVGPKGENGIQGDQGVPGEDGTDATVYTFSLTFTSTISEKTFLGLGTYDENKDAVLVYMQADGYNTLLPYTWLREGAENILFHAETTTSGTIYIYTKWANGDTASPWGSDATFNFKAVLIKGISGNKSNFDYSDYEKVKKHYSLIE